MDSSEGLPCTLRNQARSPLGWIWVMAAAFLSFFSHRKKSLEEQCWAGSGPPATGLAFAPSSPAHLPPPPCMQMPPAGMHWLQMLQMPHSMYAMNPLLIPVRPVPPTCGKSPWGLVVGRSEMPSNPVFLFSASLCLSVCLSNDASPWN